MSEKDLTVRIMDGKISDEESDEEKSATIHLANGDTRYQVPGTRYQVTVAKCDEVDALSQFKFDNFNANTKEVDINSIGKDEFLSGVVMFRGITRETKGKFIRVCESKSPDLVWELMEKKLKIKKPSLIVSVSGGCRDFKLPESLKACFKATIQKASQIHDSCIISGGTYSGVMKLVSDAFVQGKGVCLGITAWDSIISNDVCVKKDPTHRYVVGSWLPESSKNRLYLDYKHTHYIMVQEENNSIGEVVFRTRLEKYLIQKHKCPAVMIVVNGGWFTLETIHEAVAHGVCPIVVVEKSGRVADMMAYAIIHYHAILEKWKAGERHPKMVYSIKNALYDGEGKEDEVEQCYQKVISCLEKKTMFSVATMGSDNDIDAAVIEALLSGKKNEIFEKLKLILLWDRADYARQNILSSSVHIDDKDLNYLMIMALARGNHKFVELLMDYGVNMYELLTEEILEFIYGFQSKEDNFPLNNIIDLGYKEHDNLILTKEDRKDKQCIKKDVIQGFWKEHLCPLFLDNHVKVIDKFKGEEKNNLFEDPFWELFLWAVVCNLPEMAKFLWPFGRDQMAKALVAAQVWRYLSKLEDTHKDYAVTLKAGSKAFSDLAQQLLDSCFSCQEDQTIELITTTLRQVPNMTCIDIAGATKHYEFIAHNSVQTLLTDVWTGQIAKRIMCSCDYIKVLIGIVFPFLVLDDIDLSGRSNYYWTTIRKDEEETAKESIDHTAQEIREEMKAPQKISMKTCKKLKSFYFETPLVSFILHVFSSVFFLVLYIYMTIWGRIGIDKSWMDVLLVVWVFGHFVAELYQLTQYDTTSFHKKLTFWFSDSYNKFDAANILAFFLAWVMSFHQSTLGVSRTLHAINCGCWILRVMTIIRIHRTFGLYLEMVQEMLKELFWFLFILFTVIFAYAVTSTAILYPGVPDPMVLLRMFLRSWFHVYGEYFIEYPPGTNTTHLVTPLRNSYDEYVVWVIFGFYLLFTNILLLNIIIAAFNTTYANIQEKASVISKYRRYDLIVEYSKRISTPAPLSLIQHFIMFIYKGIMLCQKTKFARMREKKENEGLVNTKLRQMCKSVHPVIMEELREFEYYCAKQICSAESAESLVIQEEPQQELNSRIAAKLESKLLVSIEKMEERICENSSKIFKELESKLSHLEHRVDHLISNSKEK